MPGIERQGDLASCGTHSNTGSISVFSDGRGVTRAGFDSVGTGIIMGGVLTVFVDGYPVSKPGDFCGHPSESPHTNAVTGNPSITVFAG